jgi:hypothetical protein
VIKFVSQFFPGFPVSSTNKTMLPMEMLVKFTGACANEIIPSINRSFVYKAKEGLILEFIFYAKFMPWRDQIF